jgi:hypothetical protein
MDVPISKQWPAAFQHADDALLSMQEGTQAKLLVPMRLINSTSEAMVGTHSPGTYLPGKSSSLDLSTTGLSL